MSQHFSEREAVAGMIASASMESPLGLFGRLVQVITGASEPTASLERWVMHPASPDGRWARLSVLWDSYLVSTGERVHLGSWQTPIAVAAFQARSALALLGTPRDGLLVIDPCVGTGVYFEAVAREIAEPLSRHARYVGSDLAPEAVAITSGRAKALRISHTLRVADALTCDNDSDLCRGSSPVLVIGNPPYGRGMLDTDAYTRAQWVQNIFGRWKTGSGGRGALHDPYIAFWAWAFDLVDTSGDVRAPGVISFITNRKWIEGRAYAPMRAWASDWASVIDITDFGPGSHAGGAGSWSASPFGIKTGTAIVSIRSSPGAIRTEPEIKYRRGYWEASSIQAGPDTRVSPARFAALKPRDRVANVEGETLWVPAVPHLPLDEGIQVARGIQTAEDSRWIKTVREPGFDTIHAYRAFDNRWAVSEPPKSPPSTRGRRPHEARPGSRWRHARLFGPHDAFIAAGGWYAVLPAGRLRPGPAAHPTIHLPDNEWFGGRGGRIIRVTSGRTVIPVGYRDWANSHEMDGSDFWRYAVACAHHRGYWTAGHPYAAQLEEQRVEPLLVDDPWTITRLIGLGADLLRLWSLDDVKPAPHRQTADGWEFDGEQPASQVNIHGRVVLSQWQKSRLPRDKWDRGSAAEFGSVIAAVNEVVNVSHAIAGLLAESDSGCVHHGG